MVGCMSWESVLKLAAFAACVMVALQIVFYFVFEIIGYDSYLLSIILIASVIVAILFLVLWNTAKKRA
jgi:predicted neutral ceramidase superfamily lipid hydrolase